MLLVFIELVPFKENEGNSKELELLKPAAVAADDDMACCRDLGKEAVKAKAAAAAAALEALLRCSLVVEVEAGIFANDSNCKRGCLKTKLLGFKEPLALPLTLPLALALLLLGVVELQPKFENTFVDVAAEENVVESLDGSRLKSFDVFRTRIKGQNDYILFFFFFCGDLIVNKNPNLFKK